MISESVLANMKTTDHAWLKYKDQLISSLMITMDEVRRIL